VKISSSGTTAVVPPLKAKRRASSLRGEVDKDGRNRPVPEFLAAGVWLADEN
jgi:hypothetical protein